MTENVFNGRGIDDYQSDDVEIDHNQMTLTQDTIEPVIFVHKDSSRTQILDNAITREASTGDGAVISAAPHGSGTPDHLTIEGNALIQKTSFHVISTSGIVGLYIRHNKLTYSGPLANVMSGVLALGSADAFGIRTTEIQVEGNRFEGPMRGAVSTSGSYFGVGTVDTADNVATGVKHGIYCENYATQGGVTGPITSTGDSWPAPECGPKGFVEVFSGGGSSPTPAGPGEVPPGTAPAPNTSLRRKPRPRSANRSARFTFAADQPGSTFRCKLDGRAFAPCRSPFRLKAKRGRHIFRVQAVGPSGIPDPTPAVFRWKVL